MVRKRSAEVSGPGRPAEQYERVPVDLPSGAPRPRAGRQVAIFGAGIAGLTAAHELIERGYDVEVYEAEEADPVQERIFGDRCALGGLARTRWACVPSDTPLDRQRALSVPRLVNERITFSKKDSSDDLPALDDAGCATLDLLIKALRECKGRSLTLALYGFGDERRPWPSELPDFDPSRPPMSTAGLDLKRAWVAARYIARVLPVTSDVSIKIRVIALGLGRGDDWSCRDDERCYVEAHLVHELVPGEHGFRFFPSYYRHVFDTLERIPIADDNRPSFHETPRTVLDNILAVDEHKAGREGPEKSFSFPRRPVISLREAFDMTESILTSLNMEGSDIQQHLVKLFKYATSCSARREREYEYQSWSDFMDADAFTESFRTIFEQTGRITIATPPSECDARTYGNASLQLFLNQLLPSARTDGTLNGPTSVTWFNHWRRYLESQGVRFYHGELVGFTAADAEQATPHPVVILPGTRELAAGTGQPPDSPPLEGAKKTIVMRDYYVVAVPLHEAQKLVNNDHHFVGGDFDRLRAMDLSGLDEARPSGMLRHLRGIQFFLATDGGFPRGHTSYIDSPWGLSSISQPQFWLRKRGWWDGYRGVLSVDIGVWDVAGRKTGKVAWDSTPDELAAEVWEEVRATFTEEERELLPNTYLAYHYDADDDEKADAAVEGESAASDETDGERGEPDDEPYLITRPGEYPLRPGRLDEKRGYDVRFGRLVFAGVYMQTYTRLTTMEAANESGRHAVNGILDADPTYHGARCRVWDPERHEPPDLEVFKELDERLVAMGLPHFADILDLRELPVDIFDPGAVLEQILARVRAVLSTVNFNV